MRPLAVLLACVALLVVAPAAHAAPPANDAFADAAAISVGDRVAGTNVEATEEAGEPDHVGNPVSASVWYRYDAGAGGTVHFDACTRDYDVVLAVYSGDGTGDTVDSVTFEAGYDDSCGTAGGGARVPVTAAPGEVLYVVVDGYEGDTGTFELAVEDSRPDNDDFADATALDPDGLNTFSTADATREPGEPFHAGTPGDASIWFTYTPAETMPVQIDLECDFDSLLAIYSGDSLGALTEIASDDDGGIGGCSRADFFVEAGKTYRVAVDGFAGQTGAGDLIVTEGPACTIAGTLGDDALEGTSGDDVLCGLAGDDVLVARGGDDLVFGAEGSDRLSDGAGFDYADGGSGSDVVVAGADDDVFVGGSGTDRLDYSARVFGVFIDLDCGCAGDSDDDTHDGFEDADGGSGRDIIFGTDARNRLTGGAGTDVLVGYDGDDVLDGGGAGDGIEAGDGDDEIDPGSGPDSVSADDGADVVAGSPGRDTLDGGAGADTLTYAARGDAEDLVVRLDGVRNDGADPDGSGGSSVGEEADRDIAFERAVGGGGDDRLSSGTGANVLTGGPGDDRLDGGAGADTLDGGPGVDTISYASRLAGVAVTLDGLRNDGADGDANGTSSPAEEADLDRDIEGALGGAGTDKLTGSGAANALSGGGAADVLTGGPGGDALDGGAKDDTLDGGTGADTLAGGSGVDTVTYAARGAGEHVVIRFDGARNDGADPDWDGTSTAAEEGDLIDGVENAKGGGGNDRLIAVGGPNVLEGGAGDDRLTGGVGRDTLDGGPGSDTMLYEGRGAAEPVAVTLDGQRNDGADPNGDGASADGEEADLDLGIENVLGGSGADRLSGSPAVNLLIGATGDDVIDARDGTADGDKIFCGRGTDQFGADPSDTATDCETALAD